MNATVLSLTRQNRDYVVANAQNIGQDASLRPSPGDAASFNWILGHIVYWRNVMLEMAGIEPVWLPDRGERYRGSPGERKPFQFDPNDALTVVQISHDLNTMQERVEAWLSGDEVELPDHFLNLLLHEAYHAGQLGVLRRGLGLDGSF